jgi:cell division protein FtsA
MSGLRLEVKVHIVTGAVSAAQNIVKCVRRCGLEVNDLILQPLASSLAVLTEDEKELGVVLVDIGGGTTDIAIYSQGSIRHTAVIPIAGDQITNDIAMALRTPTVEAEDLKIHYGIARQDLADSTAMIDVPGTSLMPGMVELAEQVFLKPARIGTPEYRGHLHEVLRSPRFSTGIGLLMEGQAQLMRGRRVSQSGSFQGAFVRMKEWFAGNF